MRLKKNQSFCVYKWNNENRELFRRVIIGNLPEFNNIVNSIDTINKSSIKVRGPFVETPRIFLSMQNINYAEILA